MAQRMQSPSSINTYKQCPRKYYYQYIKKLKTKPSIHLVRGVVAHSVLEDFFDQEIKGINELNYELKIKNVLQEYLVKLWQKNKKKFDELHLTQEQLNFYFDETMMMVLNFANVLVARLQNLIKEGMPYKEAIQKLTPEREEKFMSQKYMVMGYIDAIEKREDGIYIIDYKTSKKPIISDAYRLQLGIYSLLYYEKYGKMPDKLGIFFLKEKEICIKATDEILRDAKFEIEQIHFNTETKDINDYPMKPSPLCKWANGQCDFYEYCFEGKKLDDN